MTGLGWRSPQRPPVEAGADATRPLALGYVGEWDTPMGEAEVALARRILAQFAESEGYALGAVYVERMEQTPAAFEALVTTVIRDEVAVVIVPGAEHLALIGSVTDMAAHLTQRTGARILEARQVPTHAAAGVRPPSGPPGPP